MNYLSEYSNSVIPPNMGRSLKFTKINIQDLTLGFRKVIIIIDCNHITTFSNVSYSLSPHLLLQQGRNPPSAWRKMLRKSNNGTQYLLPMTNPQIQYRTFTNTSPRALSSLLISQVEPAKTGLSRCTAAKGIATAVKGRSSRRATFASERPRTEVNGSGNVSPSILRWHRL